MNYQPRNKPRLSRYSSAAGIVAVVLVLVIILSFAAPSLLSGFFSRLFSPLWRLTGDFSSSENVSLQQQIEAQSADTAAIVDLEQENAELKAMLGRPLSGAASNGTAGNADSFILATVIKKPPFSAYDSMIIDIGADHGLIVGDMVYAVSSTPMSASSTVVTSSSSVSTLPNASSSPASIVRVPIGFVTEVDAVTSRIDLFSSPGNTYPVEIGKDHIAVTATGRGAGTFESILPPEANVAVGDSVIIPSITPLVFATVTAITDDPTSSYDTILFQSPVNPFTLHWVEVGVGGVGASGGVKK